MFKMYRMLTACARIILYRTVISSRTRGALGASGPTKFISARAHRNLVFHHRNVSS